MAPAVEHVRGERAHVQALPEEQLRELRDLKRAALDQSAALYPRLGLLAAFAALVLLL